MRTMALVIGGVGATALAALLAIGGAPGQAQQQAKPAADSITAPVISDTGSLKGPRQPIFFRHDIHAGQFKMQCQYCHYSVAVSPEPGIPSMQTCMGCHLVVGRRRQRGARPRSRSCGRPGPTKKPIEWVRVHYLAAPRPLPAPAAHQGARSQRLHHLPRRREPHAAGLQGEQRQQHGLLHHLPRRAEGLARLLGVSLLKSANGSRHRLRAHDHGPTNRDLESTMDRRRFLTVVGARAAARSRSPAAPPAGSRSWCRTWCSRRIRSRRRHLVREHLHRVRGGLRRARADARGPRGQARRQSRASGQPGQALLPRAGGAPGPLQSRPRQGADGARTRTARFSEITWDEAIARLAGKLRQAGQQGGGGERGGAGHLLRSARRVDRRRSAGGWSATSRSITSRSAPPTGRCSGWTSCRRTTSAAPSTSCPSAPTSSRPGSRRSRTSAASPSRTASPTGDVAKFVYAAPRMDLTGLNADEWLATRPGTETALALAMAQRRGRGGARRLAVASALAKFTPAMAAAGDRRPGRADRAHRAGVRRGAAEPGGGGRRRGAACRARSSSARRSTCSTTSPATSGRRCGSAPSSTAATAYVALARLAAAMDARPGGGAARARRQPGLHAAQDGRASPSRLKKVPFKVSTSTLPRRDRRAVRPAAAPAPRARAVGRPRARAPACGA